MLVPPKPFVTLAQLPIFDWTAAGKCTVTPVHPESILLNWFVADPKLLVVSAGNERVVSALSFWNAYWREYVPVRVASDVKVIEVNAVQSANAYWSP